MNTVISSPGDSDFKAHFRTVETSNPFLKNGLIVFDQQSTASLCVYENPDLSHRGAPIMLFGNINTPDNPDLFDKLLSAAEKLAIKQQKKYLIGPMNGSVWHEYRLPTSGDQPTFTGDLAAPLYYEQLFRNHQFEAIEKYYSYSSGVSKGTIPVVFPEGIVVRSISSADITKQQDGLYELCMQAFQGNPFYSPLDRDDFIKRYQLLIGQLDKELILVATKNNQTIAFVLAYGDPLNPGTIIIKTVAKHPHHDVPGLMTNMVRLLMRKIDERGFNRVVYAFMYENNKSIARAADFGGKILRSYALFAKNISN